MEKLKKQIKFKAKRVDLCHAEADEVKTMMLWNAINETDHNETKINLEKKD